MSENKKKKEFDFDTVPLDARFANANVTKYCYIMFLDYIKCTRLLGDGYKGCEHFKKCYQTLCPNSWTERWNSQIDEGTFPHPLPEKK